MSDEIAQIKAKARVITIMTLVKSRLRQDNIKLGSGREEPAVKLNTTVPVPTLVDRIRERGCKLAGNRFADIFMSRPKRLVIAEVDEIILTFDTILEMKKTYLSASELLELCDLLRFPLSQIHHFSKHFSPDEWRNALLYYQLMPARVGDETNVLGRDALIEQIVDFVWHNRSRGRTWRGHVILSGASGVGKSTVAHAVIRRLAVFHNKRIHIVSIGNTMTSMEQVLYAIGVALGLKLRNNEPWYLRLKDYDYFSQGILVLDNVLGNDILPAETILKNLVIMFPETQFIITTQVSGLETHIPNAREYALTGLAEDDARQLFWRIFQQADGRSFEHEQVTHIIAQTNGFPMLLIAAANGAARGYAEQSSDVYRQVVIGLGRIPELMLQIMSLVSYPLSMRFWESQRQLVQLPANQHPQTYLHLLERRQLITHQRGDGYAIHDVLRYAVLQSLDASATKTLLAYIGQQLVAESDIHNNQDDELHAQLSQFDMLAVLQLVRLMEQHQLDEEMIAMCVYWRMKWIRYGMAADLCALSEAGLYRVGDNHPLTCTLLFSIGSYYGHRGIVESTVRFLTQAMHKAEQLNERAIWAFAAIECALLGVQNIGINESERLLWRAMTFLVPLQLHGWLALCHDILSYLYMLNGDLAKSLHESDEALQMLGNNELSYGLADVYSNRGLIFMMMGDYSMARQALNRAEWMYQRLNAPSNLAAVHLRIAGIAILSNMITDARFYLTQAFLQLERTGGMHDLLYTIDVCAGIMLAEGDGVGTLQLVQACNIIRETLKLPRGMAFDEIMRRQLVYADILVNGEKVPPLPANIDELLNVERRVLKLNVRR